MTPHQKALFTQRLTTWLINHPTWPYITQTELFNTISTALESLEPVATQYRLDVSTKDQDDFSDWLKSIKRRQNGTKQ